MRFPDRLRSKRGIAMETAILFMVLIFSLCFLLTTLAMIGHYRVELEHMTLLSDVAVEQIGEDYLASLKTTGNAESFAESYDDYDYAVSGNALTVWRKTDESKTAVLYVEAELTDGEISVMQWRYTLPN